MGALADCLTSLAFLALMALPYVLDWDLKRRAIERGATYLDDDDDEPDDDEPDEPSGRYQRPAV